MWEYAPFASAYLAGKKLPAKKSVEKKNILRGVGARRFLRARCAWAGSGGVAGTNWADWLMLSLAGGAVVDALVLRI
jgi:hypothetical protein